jgi:hypothetical protein
VTAADLYSLLGLSRDVSPDLLRYTYEQHIADATHRHDLTRAAALSAAFDSLDPTTKAQLYSGRGSDEHPAPRFENGIEPRHVPQPSTRMSRTPPKSQPALRWPFKILAGRVCQILCVRAIG